MVDLGKEIIEAKERVKAKRPRIKSKLVASVENNLSNRVTYYDKPNRPSVATLKKELGLETISFGRIQAERKSNPEIEKFAKEHGLQGFAKGLEKQLAEYRQQNVK